MQRHAPFGKLQRSHQSLRQNVDGTKASFRLWHATISSPVGVPFDRNTNLGRCCQLELGGKAAQGHGFGSQALFIVGL